MSFDLTQLLMSPTNLLWLVASIVAASILCAAINRRRARLTESLRSYVQRSQGDSRPGRTEGPKD